jgi:glutathione peroxidase
MITKKISLVYFFVLFGAFLVTLIFPGTTLAAKFDPGVHQFKVQNIKNQAVDMASYRGKVLLIVNTASFCGFTSQYKSLQKTYDQFKHQGFLVLGFPCNDFGSQEPGSNKEIKDFCELNYKVTFPLFAKVVVSGNQKTPLFKYLTEDTGLEFKRPIDWNFEKFLIDRDGRLIARYKSATDPQSEEILTAITAALKAKASQPSAIKALPTAKPDK